MSREHEPAHIMCPNMPPDCSGRTLKCFSLAVLFPAWSLVISWPKKSLDDVTHPGTHTEYLHIYYNGQLWSWDNTIPCWGLEPSRTPIHCWWEYKMAQACWKTAWRFFIKLSMLLLYDPVTICDFTQKTWELMYTWMLLVTLLMIAKT